MAKMKEFFKRWIKAFIDPRKILGFAYLFRYIVHWRQYQCLSGEKLKFSQSYPCLTDWVKSTPFDGHYFYQAAWLAREISCRRPVGRHIDIGSDIRIIAVLSGFVDVEFVDFRPLDISLSNLNCIAGDITALPYKNDFCDSISCLHVVEHIGLGRYGDPIDAYGSIKALSELARILKPGGCLFISVPVGQETIFFNAHRVFNPATIINGLSPLRLCSFSLVTDAGKFILSANIEDALTQSYGCGMFVFCK